MSDIQIKVKEHLIERIFEEQKKQFKIDKAFPWSNGSFKVRGSVKAHLKDGDINLIRAGLLSPKEAQVEIKELDIVWEDVRFQFGLDIPTVTIGGGCIIRAFGRCRLRLPRKSFFKSKIDIRTPEFRLPQFRSEISMSAIPIVNKESDRYEVKLQAFRPDIDFIDIADTIGDALDSFVDLVVDKLLGFLPSWARSLVKRILGSLTKLIRRLLDIGDDLEEWLSKILGVSFGVFDIIADVAMRVLGTDFKIFELDNPYQIMDGQNNLKPIMLPITNLGVNVDADKKTLNLNANF
jgi:hypothetical protein